jgi:thioredoxin 1
MLDMVPRDTAPGDTAPGDTAPKAVPTKGGEAGAVRRISGSADFEATVLASDLPVLVDFWAAWCPPCRMISPIVQEIAREMAGALTVASVDVEEHPDLAQRYQAFGLPTLSLFVGGVERMRLIGAHPKRRILAEIGETVARPA